MPADPQGLLKKLGGSGEMNITVVGRSSKKRRSTPVWFIVEGKTVRIVPVKGSETQWFRNLTKNPRIELAAGGVSVSSEAKLVKDPEETERILDKLRAKYRSMWSESYYPKHDAYVEVRL